MLKAAKPYATLPAIDLERAKRFYEQKLGLLPESETLGAVFYLTADGTRLGSTRHPT